MKCLEYNQKHKYCNALCEYIKKVTTFCVVEMNAFPIANLNINVFNLVSLNKYYIRPRRFISHAQRFSTESIHSNTDPSNAQ